MPTKTLDFNTLTAANPYVIGSAPDNLTGYAYTNGSGTGLIGLDPKQFYLSGGTQAIWYDTTLLTGTWISSEVKLGTTNGNLCGAVLVDANGNGYGVYTSDAANTCRIFVLTANAMGGSPILTISQTHAIDNLVKLRRNTATGVMQIWVNGSQIGTPGSNEVTHTGFDPRYAGAVSRYGRIKQLTSEYTPSQTVTSINGGNPIIQGATAVPAALSGFTGRPTSISTNQAGLTASNIGGTTNAPTFNISGWSEGAQYPSLPVSANFTFAFGGESATGSQTITHPAGYVKLTLSGAITDDADSIAKYFTDAGHVAEGGEFEYLPYGDLVFSADGMGTATNAGTVNGWFRPSTGTTAGRVYQFTFNIAEGGAITDADWMRPIESTPIRMTPITMRAI